MVAALYLAVLTCGWPGEPVCDPQPVSWETYSIV